MASKPRRSTPPPPRDPPTVAAVRAARSRLWREGGGTLEGVLKIARERAASYGVRPSPTRKSRKAA